MAEEGTREATGASQQAETQNPPLLEFLDSLRTVVQQELRTALTSGVHLVDAAPGPATSVATSMPSGASGQYIPRFVVKINS